MVSELDITMFTARLAEVTRDNRPLLENLFRSEIIKTGALRNIRLHVLKSDGNGRPQVNMLVRSLSEAIIDYCIPRRQIIDALEHQKKTNSTRRIVALSKTAQSLFTDIAKTGEGGELLLYILTESILKYPQALSKMALKTNTRMHIHGADGVYVSCTGAPPKLRIHYGESKLHKDPGEAIRSAIKSVANILKDEGFLQNAKQDYYLLNSYTDLGQADLEEALKCFLDPNDPQYRNPEVCAVLLAGHDVANYPHITETCPLPQELLDKCHSMVSSLESVAKETSIDAFFLDVFLVPFPSVADFRSLLLSELGISGSVTEQNSE